MDVSIPLRGQPPGYALPYLFWRWLEASGYEEFAFAISVHGEAYFAVPTNVAGVVWSPVVSLIQGMKATKLQDFGMNLRLSPNIYAKYKAPGNPNQMDVGMVRFIQRQLVTEIPNTQQKDLLNPNVSPEVISAKIIDSNGGIPEQIEPLRVLDRAELIHWANLTSLGPPPNVPLYSFRESRYHRLYMIALVENMYTKFYLENSVQGHPIAAMMVNSKSGEIVGWAPNTTKTHYTCHAEVNLVQAVRKRNVFLERHPVVYTTLKPCIMCAGMIREMYPDAKVVYLQNDPGEHCNYNLADFAPTGGMHQLTRGAFKPLKLTDKSDFAVKIDDRYKQYKEQLQLKQQPTGVVSFLKDEETKNLFNHGMGGLELKRNKYKNDPKYKAMRDFLAEEDPSNPLGDLDVERILKHLLPFVGQKW